MTDFAGRTTSFGYSGNRLVSVTHPDDTIAYYDYDSDGQLTSMYDAEAKYGVSYGMNPGV